jgi:hypothetical protein
LERIKNKQSIRKMIKVGDRVRNIRVEVYKDEPIVVIDIYDNKRYHLEYLNVYTVQNTNMLSWVDEDDITLDIEYYRNLKLEKLLNE